MDIVSNDVNRYDPYLNSQGGQKNDMWLRTEPRQKPYIFRLVSDIYGYRQHWNAFKPLQNKPVTSPAFDVKDKDKDVAWNQGNFVPTKRYAAVVLNRETGKLQIIQGGAQVFNPIFDFIKSTKKLGRAIDPAGENGPDWVLTVEKEGDRPKYTCDHDPSGPKPFTPEERELIATFPNDWKLRYFKSATPEEIQALYDKLPEERKHAPEENSGSFGGRTTYGTSRTVEKPVSVQASTEVVGATSEAELADGDNPEPMF